MADFQERVSVQLTAEQAEALEQIAHEQDRSIAYVIRQAVDAYLASREAK